MGGPRVAAQQAFGSLSECCPVTSNGRQLGVCSGAAVGTERGRVAVSQWERVGAASSVRGAAQLGHEAGPRRPSHGCPAAMLLMASSGEGSGCGCWTWATARTVSSRFLRRVGAVVGSEHRAEVRPDGGVGGGHELQLMRGQLELHRQAEDVDQLAVLGT